MNHVLCGLREPSNMVTLSVSLNTCFGIAGGVSDEVVGDTGMSGGDGICGTNVDGIHGRIIGIFGGGTDHNTCIHRSRSIVY